MKIAHIGSRGFPGMLGGVEKSLEEICPRLAARGHDVSLYCSDHVATREPLYRGTFLRRMPAICTKCLETPSRVLLSGWDALFRDYDIVHFHAIGPALFSWMTRLGRKRSKTVATVHGLDWQRAKWGALARRVLQVGEKCAVLFPHRTIVVSEHLKRYYKEHYGKEVVYIPNGVVLREPLPPFAIRQWSLKPGGYVLFVGRLVPEKECHTLIQAFLRLRTDKKLVIAGASWHSDDYVKMLKEMAAGRPDIVFTGWAEGDVLRELFSNAYLYCLPSQIEGLSLSLLEAMSYGLCALVSDIPENRDVIGPNGMMFRTGDHVSLAESLNALLGEPERVRRLGRQARDAVRERYDWDRIAGDLENTYADLLKNG